MPTSIVVSWQSTQKSFILKHELTSIKGLCVLVFEIKLEAVD